MLEKFKGNPVLRPIPQHPWESRCVFNCAAIFDGGRAHIVYRAVGDDDVSRLGYASSPDGFHFDTRLPEPIFVPEGNFERKGCEDPRITRIGNEYYMFYTAYDGHTAQIGQVAIKRSDFLAGKWNWGRRTYPFPKVNNKDVVLFPNRIKGKWVLYHRIPPHIWVAYSDDLLHWGKSNIVMMPRGLDWESVKLGAGAPPIKTYRGWIFIYHAMDEAKVYRLGLAIIALDNPEEVMYRSKHPILEPTEEFEQKGDVPNIVFTCGAFVNGQRLFVYYGGADTTICLATQKLHDLWP